MPIFNPVLIGGGVDTSDATATAADLADGKTAYTADGLITGTSIVVPPGSEYFGFSPRQFTEVPAGSNRVLLLATQFLQGGYLILESYKPHMPYYVLAYMEYTDEYATIMMTGKSGDHAEIKVYHGTGSMLSRRVVIEPVDPTIMLDEYVKAYAYGSFNSRVIT